MYPIAYLYASIGLYCVCSDIMLHDLYVALLVFISFKVIFQYEKCTVSYIEVKARNVKKEEGFLYSLLNSFVKIRETNHFYILLVMTIFILISHYTKKYHLMNQHC